MMSFRAFADRPDWPRDWVAFFFTLHYTSSSLATLPTTRWKRKIPLPGMVITKLIALSNLSLSRSLCPRREEQTFYLCFSAFCRLSCALTGQSSPFGRSFANDWHLSRFVGGGKWGDREGEMLDRALLRIVWTDRCKIGLTSWAAMVKPTKRVLTINYNQAFSGGEPIRGTDCGAHDGRALGKRIISSVSWLDNSASGLMQVD